jgi:hypothetical protein
VDWAFTLPTIEKILEAFRALVSTTSLHIPVILPRA